MKNTYYSIFWVILSVIVLNACVKEKAMNDIKMIWQKVVESSNATEEAEKIEEFAQMARDNKLMLHVTLLDSQTGKKIAIQELDNLSTTPKVRLSLKQNNDHFQLEWHPKQKENVYPLLLE